MCFLKDCFLLSFRPKICAYLKICVAIEANGNANLYLALVIADLVICVCFRQKVIVCFTSKSIILR